MKTYSQDKQDITLYTKVFNDKLNGFFIEIGANDGITYSNTFFYEQLGWSGICVEPHPVAFAKCVDIRDASLCQSVNVCISSIIPTVRYLQVDGPPEMLSGILEFYDDKHLNRVNLEIKRDGGSKAIHIIESLTFPQLCEKYNAPSHIDYLSIDAEGGELDIIKTIDFITHTFGIIGCENNFNTMELENYMNSVGYKKLGTIGADDIYAKI
jgi:FkbM family methyltransferase